MKKILVTIAIALLSGLILFGTACNSGVNPTVENSISGKVIKGGPIGDKLTVTLSNDTGKLKNGQQEITLAFTDLSGKAVDVGMVNAAALNFHMPAMGSMSAMNSAASFTTTDVPGVYKGKVNIQMAGEWQAQISFEGSAGSAKTMIPVSAQ
ncbi:MAG: FixH family protein [Pyrinomonadaceae bacterium]